MFQETHPFQVAIWMPGTGKAQSVFEYGQWEEQARCSSLPHADEVAICLFMRWPAGVRIAKLVDGKFVPCKFFPKEAGDLGI